MWLVMYVLIWVEDLIVKVLGWLIVKGVWCVEFVDGFCDDGECFLMD